MELANKKVFITGGTRGIGRALAEQLHTRGCEVMVCGRRRDSVRQVQQALGIRALSLDITDADAAARLVSAVRGELAGLDILINNAGLQRELDLTAELSRADLEPEIALNLLAPLAVTQALLPLLLSARDAAIVNVTSTLAIAPAPRAPVYSATKAALSSLTHSWRAQLRTSGVRVVEVVPPVVKTEMTDGRNEGAISAEQAAEGIVRGLCRGRQHVVLGQARMLSLVHRLSPHLARHVLQRR